MSFNIIILSVFSNIVLGYSSHYELDTSIYDLEKLNTKFFNDYKIHHSIKHIESHGHRFSF